MSNKNLKEPVSTPYAAEVQPRAGTTLKVPELRLIITKKYRSTGLWSDIFLLYAAVSYQIPIEAFISAIIASAFAQAAAYSSRLFILAFASI